jgi:translation elongation factor EF-4
MDGLFQLLLFPQKILEFKKYVCSVASVASAARSLYQVVEGATEQRGVPFHSVLEELQNAFRALIEELKEQFPPPEEAPGHEMRTLVINAVLDRMEGTFLRIAIEHGANEEDLKNHTSSLMSGVRYTVVTISTSQVFHCSGTLTT